MIAGLLAVLAFTLAIAGSILHYARGGRSIWADRFIMVCLVAGFALSLAAIFLGV